MTVDELYSKCDEEVAKYYDWRLENRGGLARVVGALEGLDVKLRLGESNTWLNVACTGTKAQMKRVIGALVLLGYVGFDVPDGEKRAYYSVLVSSSYMPDVYFEFSSTQCTRVKVGTEMVEHDVYEVQCE